MELRQLRYFVAVADEGNISRAAKKIFLTQPALSRQIKALEDEIGGCLLERQAHSIRLTALGELLVREARDLLEQADRVLERVRSEGKGGRVRVGYAPSLASGFLSEAVENFSQAHPRARIELFDLATQEMLAGLESGSLDVAVTVGRPSERRGLVWTPLRRATWQLVVNRNHAFARRKAISPADVAGEPLLFFCRRDYPEYWEMMHEWLGEHGLRPRITGEYDGVDSLMAAVESGLGVALLTARGADRVSKRVQLKLIDPAPEPLCIVAGWRSSRSSDKALAVFIEELRRAATALG